VPVSLCLCFTVAVTVVVVSSSVTVPDAVADADAVAVAGADPRAVYRARVLVEVEAGGRMLRGYRIADSNRRSRSRVACASARVRGIKSRCKAAPIWIVAMNEWNGCASGFVDNDKERNGGIKMWANRTTLSLSGGWVVPWGRCRAGQ